MLLASTVVALPDALAGQASVIDGDTLEIHGTRIRLWGIDAPESSQLCRNDESELHQCGRTASANRSSLVTTNTSPLCGPERNLSRSIATSQFDPTRT